MNFFLLVASPAALLAPGRKNSPLAPAAAASPNIAKSFDSGKADGRTKKVYEELLAASSLLDGNGHVMLSVGDVETALSDLHLQHSQTPLPGAVHPLEILPTSLFAQEPVDVTALVRETMPRVLEAHPIFTYMAEETLGNDAFFESVYFGTSTRDASTSLDFPQLCRRLIASVYVFELLIGMEREKHRQLAQWYEVKLRAARHSQTRHAAAAAAEQQQQPAATRSPRDALMGFFLAVKGESVLASINAFEMLRRLDTPAADGVGANGAPVAEGTPVPGSSSTMDFSAMSVASLSSVLRAIMSLNIFEAVLSNLSFAFWPDNARAGMALQLSATGEFDADGSQQLSTEWRDLYLAWNANFVWPSHYCADMMAFTMLVAPTIALGDPRDFQYNRAHTLFWVARATQLTRLENGPLPHEPDAIPCFRCRQLEPIDDRQPLTSRTAKRTRAAGERLAARSGSDVSGSGVWWALLADVPAQLSSLVRLYRLMPKDGPAKLRLL